MNEATVKLLETLAAKMGTTTEYLWGVLLKQAPITAVIDLVVMAIWITLGVGAYKVIKYNTTPRIENPNDEKYYHRSRANWEDEVGVGLSWICLGAYAIFVAIMVGANLSSSLAGLLNPEYWALKQLMALR